MRKIKAMLAMPLAAIYLMPSFLYAQTDEEGRDFMYDGIIYTVIDEEAKTCRTKAREWSWDVYEYAPVVDIEGDLNLPSNPTDGESSYTLVEIGDYSFISNSRLNSVTIPSTVKKIGNTAFHSCSSLKDIKMHDEITTIGKQAFQSCAVERIELPGHLDSIPFGLFCSCSDLTSVTVPDGVTRIEDMAFSGCRNLVEVNLPNSVIEIGKLAFEYCGFKNFIFPNSLKTIERDAFAMCEQLEEIYLPDSLSELGMFAFQRCRGLGKINLSSSLTEINGGTFCQAGYNSGIDTLAISPSVRRINDGLEGEYDFEPAGAFRYINVKSVIMPADLEYIGTFSFEGSSVENLTLPSNVREIKKFAFSECHDLRNVYYDTTNPIEATDAGIFECETYDKATLYVAVGGAEKARATEPWCNFQNIVEYDFSGVGVTYTNEMESSAEVFDLQGRKASDSKDNLSDGVYIIREGGKVSKTMVRH